MPALAGFLYLAIVLDVFSRRVVGWATAAHLGTALVTEALEMAVRQRRPAGVIHHSDQGCQYTSLAFGARCRQWGVAPSMGSVGDCYGNAMAESFFAPLAFERRQQADPVDGARPVDARRAPTSPLDPALRARAPHRPQGTMYMA